MRTIYHNSISSKAKDIPSSEGRKEGRLNVSMVKHMDAIKRMCQSNNCDKCDYAFSDYNGYRCRLEGKPKKWSVPNMDYFGRCSNCKFEATTVCNECTTKGGNLNLYTVKL